MVHRQETAGPDAGPGVQPLQRGLLAIDRARADEKNFGADSIKLIGEMAFDFPEWR